MPDLNHIYNYNYRYIQWAQKPLQCLEFWTDCDAVLDSEDISHSASVVE